MNKFHKKEKGIADVKQQVGLFFQERFPTSKACSSRDTKVVILLQPSE